MPSLPYSSCGRMPNEERRERDDGRRSREPRDRGQALRVARCGSPETKAKLFAFVKERHTAVVKATTGILSGSVR